MQALRMDLSSKIHSNREQIRNLQLCLENIEKLQRVDEAHRLHTLFEARICKLLLSGIATLPVVLRRGTNTFSMMELLSLQMGSDDVGLAVKANWSAFKKICPLVDAYFAARVALLTRQSLPPQCQSTMALVTKLSRMGDAEILNLIGV